MMPNPLNREDVIAYVEQHIDDFHQARLKSLTALKLEKILKRKNPYLFKAKNVVAAPDLVKLLLDAHLSSQEETLFGDFLEGLAIFICSKAYGGRKSAVEGIDLEFQVDQKLYFVSIKSGPNWGNSSQTKKMKDCFERAIRIYKTNNRNSQVSVEAINGCCYGRDKKPIKTGYQKLCGEQFWHFISGDPNLYLNIIHPLGHQAKQRNDEFQQQFARIQTAFTEQFINHYCVDYMIDWIKIIKLNSAANFNSKRAKKLP